MLQILGVKARLLRGVRWRTLAVLFGAALGGVFAVYRRPVVVAGSASQLAAASPVGRRAASLDPGVLAAERRCLAERAELLRGEQRPLPAADQPELRAQLFGRAKATPVLFSAEPEAAKSDEPARALREQLEAAPSYLTFDNVVGKVRSSPALARAVFLREGYLYTDKPELASLYGSLTLSLLFRDPELEIVRGAQKLVARRQSDGDYQYGSGAEQGKPARLLLFDRVAAAGAAWSEPRHADLRALAAELGFDQLSIARIVGDRWVVELSYGAARVPAVLKLDGAALGLVCEAPGGLRAEVSALRGEALRAAELQSRLLSVVKEQVEEALPFDEPKTEDGQQDGQLRPEWRAAYLRGGSSFEFNGDRYAVFDASGRPRPPQVCIDFVLDTFERAGGSWWQTREKPRQRVLGRLRFDDAALENRRSVERFIDFAREHAEAFDVYQPPPEARVPLRNRQQFFAALYDARSRYQRGDIVAILGPRDDEKLHYHSFIVVDVDPLSGMPTELAANAGRPRIRSWEGEMASAPRRSIWARVRPRQLWLESFLLPAPKLSADAAESSGPRPG
jgi:hypothetical protein